MISAPGRDGYDLRRFKKPALKLSGGNMHSGVKLLPMLLILVAFMLISACGGDSDPDDTDGDADTNDAEGSDNTQDGDADDADGDVADGDTPDSDLTEDGDSVDGDEDAVETDDDMADGDVVLQCTDPITERIVEMDADETFFIGPYLQQPMPDSIIVKWRTETETDGKVLYGESEELGSEAAQEGTAVIHEVKLSGLKTATRYFYKVQSGETISAIHHFYTAPADGEAFRFTVWGDNQNGPENFVNIVAQMAGFNPWFILGVGDLVQDGTDDTLWPAQLFGPARALMHETAFYTAIGNHEHNADNLYDYYSFPYPEGEPEHETMYSFTYGNAFFLVIDTNKVYFPLGEIENEYSQWVRDQITSEAAQKATWRFALSHEPGYSEAWGDGSCTFDGNQQIRGWLLPLLGENNFHAYFSGHMHGYERGLADGVATIITGGGGGGLDAWCLDWPTTTVVHYAHNHLVVDAGCDKLRIGAYNLEGEKFDWVEIEADNPGVFSDEGPVEDLPDPPINSDSPTLTDGDAEAELEAEVE